MIDAVLSYHLNPQTCGVAKFNQQLARRLGVPCLRFFQSHEAQSPLLSIKLAEIPPGLPMPGTRCYSVFFHDWHDGCAVLARNALKVYAANQALADTMRPYRPDVVTAFCPATVDGNPTRGAYRVLSFGMASKIRDVLPHFQNLKEELDRDHPDYTLSLSTAVHEGSPWDTTLTESIEAMRAIFGDKLRVLGYLADDALAKELQDCDAVAAYFVPALRANNTSAWAALAAGKFLYTNLDAQSPALDPTAYSWEKLLDVLA